jgi:hypothetical protein
MLRSWAREDFDFRVRKAGYWGGVLGLLVLCADGAATL